jgi:hypothetical protein
MIPTFPQVIKRAHHVYTHRSIDDVLEYLTRPELPRGAIPQIPHDTRIPRQTLRDWHDCRCREDGENWFPLAEGHPHARVLGDEKEAGIANFIRTNYIRTGKGATRGILQSLCLDSYMLQKEDERYCDRFAASSHRTKPILATAEALDVELLFVPAGGTARFQPMDRQILGELKARGRADFIRRL